MCDKIYVVFLLAIVSVKLSAAASFVTKCSSSDAKCARASAIALIPAFSSGIPELNVETMDPLFLKTLDASSNDLKLVLNDITVTGLRGCDILKLERNVATSKLFATVLCDVDVKGLYEINGRILVLPIQGKGDAHVVLKKLQIDIEANLGEKTDKNGVKHWDIKGWGHKFELKDKAKIQLDNLFNGNKELAGAVNNLFDSSANEVVVEVGAPIVKGIVQKVIRNIDHFFHKLPAEDLSLD